MNKKYIVLYYNDLLFKEVLFKKLIDYYLDIKEYEVLLITKNEVNINIKQYNCLEDIFKYTKGEYIILEKLVYIDSFDEFNVIENNSLIYKNNKCIGKYIINKNDLLYKYNFKGFIYLIYNNYSIINLTKILQHKINKKLIKSGVNIVDINSTYITKDSFVDKNTTIYPNTYIVNSKIGNNCTVGPFAHIKKNSIIFGDCKIGNFVEIKNSTIGHNTKISHHAYIGDSKIGSFVNIGCGVITCNYDGLNKNQVIVNDRSFIGSNVNLIAPVTIGTDTYIASGSTVYNDADNFDFVIARSYQVNKKGYSTKYPYYRKFFS